MDKAELGQLKERGSIKKTKVSRTVTSGNYISVKEAQEILEVTTTRVCQLIKKHELEAIKVNGYSWLILADSIHGYQERKQQEKEQRRIVREQQKIERNRIRAEKARQKRALERKTAKGTTSSKKVRRKEKDEGGER